MLAASVRRPISEWAIAVGAIGVLDIVVMGCVAEDQLLGERVEDDNSIIMPSNIGMPLVRDFHGCDIVKLSNLQDHFAIGGVRYDRHASACLIVGHIHDAS